ncbi:hypothetical protein JHK82_039833 [Glycine max]|nr:hypothetical protein JHK86_040029 [Glycine max]KAG4965628.1 hypothetical protein JHK85_040603 [Glycine max]KAG5110610.1 hypothetical protein JHK82_039833 [Glycine max]KAG5121900.1 hypothetical protein JHK84_040240 [Glycine max]
MASPEWRRRDNKHDFIDYKLGRILVIEVGFVLYAIFITTTCKMMVKAIHHNHSLARVAPEQPEPPQGEAMHQLCDYFSALGLVKALRWDSIIVVQVE